MIHKIQRDTLQIIGIYAVCTGGEGMCIVGGEFGQAGSRFLLLAYGFLRTRGGRFLLIRDVWNLSITADKYALRSFV